MTEALGRSADQTDSAEPRVPLPVTTLHGSPSRSFAQPRDVHDIVIVNDDPDRAYEEFTRVILGEKIGGDGLPTLGD